MEGPSVSRSVLLVVLPHRLKLSGDASKRSVRSFLAFPYGVLTIATYLKKYAGGLAGVEILDLNLAADSEVCREFSERLVSTRPDVVGFSMSYDVSYSWLKSLVDTARRELPGTRLVAGGPAITTAHEEILSQCDLDACCYSEGEMAMRGLVEAEDLDTAITKDPWVTRGKRSAKPVYEDLDNVVDVDYTLVDVPAYSMKEAFSPFMRHDEFSRQFFIVTSRGCPFKCLSGDTPVNTIYGDIPIAELAKKYTEVPVFTYDYKTGMSKVATAKNIRYTGKEPLVRVSFDDGTHIDCTKDHKFQAFKWGNQHVDGIEWFSEAKDLKKGTHVRAIRFDPPIVNPYPLAGWGHRKSRAIHLMVMEWKLGRSLNRGERVHHENLDKTDWSPDNLILCSDQKDHFDHHPEISERMRANNPTKNGISRVWRDNLSCALTGLKRTEASKENYRLAAIKREKAKREQREQDRSGLINHRVASVMELEGLHDTYCLEVPDTGWFYANNVLVKNCVFCAEPSFHGANMRYVSVNRVVDHVAMLKDRYGLSVLTIYDDQILMNKVRAKELFRRFADLGIRIELPNGVTLSYIDAEMAQLMSAAGVDTLHLAIEHGSRRVLKDIIKKPIAYDRIGPTIKILHDAGIYCQGFFVIGLPGETAAERRETLDAILGWGLDWASFNYATPLRGSELFRMCKERGWVDPKYLDIGAIDMTQYVITAPGMDKAEIESFVFNANLEVNFVKNRNMRVGRTAVARQAFSEIIDRHPDQAFAHYYLAMCDRAEGLHAGASLVRFYEILSRAPVWRSAAERFGLELECDGAEAAGRPDPGYVRDLERRTRPGVQVRPV